MRYGIVENNKFLIIDDDKQRVINTLLFIPSLSGKDITEYSDDVVELGSDNCWYLKGYAPQKSLDEAKAAGLNELEAAFDTASQEAHCLASVGFEIDADEIANRNIEGLVLVMQAGETTQFRAYDNSFHEVTREQLEIMRKEIVINSQYLYQAKWTIEAQIMQAQTAQAIADIDVSADAIAALANTLKAQASTGNGITAAPEAVNITTNKVYL